ncbi:hypothetical protein GGI07_003541 [Coemansia sp. Benny D115]|nr:hypothetical protein GGI07_003541 [Coemansia sp. Benny D115]
MALPWRKDVFKGADLDGNMYFERFTRNSSRPRRHVVYKENINVSQYSDELIPVQWQAWMRHTREEPPSETELLQDIRRRELLAENVRRLKLQELETKKRQQIEGAGPVLDQEKKANQSSRFQKSTPGESYQPEGWVPGSGPAAADRHKGSAKS